MGRPVLVYDGECGFCRRAIAWFRAHDRGQTIEYLARQSDERARRFPALDDPRYEGAMQMLLPDGQIRSGADATAEALQRLPQRWWRGVGRALTWPLIRPCARLGYRWIATNRHRFACDTTVCR